MDSLLQQLTDWLKEMLVSGIMDNLTNTFASVNREVGEIANTVGQTPSGFLPGVYSLIRNLSENVIMPVAGIILTFIACYELIQLVISHNNLANFETWIFWKWVFKTFVAVTLITNTFNITMVIRVLEISRRKWKQRCHFVKKGLSMWSEETRIAFKLADRIISIQECNGGYDYSIMDEHYREIDGGVYDDPAVDINFVLLSIVEELKENPDTNGARGNITKESKLIPLDYDEVAELADIANMAGPAVYSSRVVMEFKAKTEQCFQPIDGLGAIEIEEMVEEYVNAKLSENDFDATVRGVVISGSRCRGLEGKSSDLDVVVELSGDEREDDLFNLLHEDNFIIGGVLVDINPITKYKTGTREAYLPDVEKYLEEKSRRISIMDKLAEKKKASGARNADAEKTVKKKSEEIR